MFEISILQMQQWIWQFVWPLFRISAFMMVAPFLGAQLVSPRVRLSLALCLTFILMPMLSSVPVFELSLKMSGLLVQEILIGLSMGFVLQVVFQVFVMAGQIIATQMGLGFASMNDPANGVSVTVLSQMYLMMVMLLFLSMNGHLVAIRALVDSFVIMPVNAPLGFGEAQYTQILALGSWLFGSALLVSLPVVSALLIVNVAFGIMTRSAPQLNIFSLGFPMTLLLGLFALWLSFAEFTSLFTDVMQQGFDQLQDLVTP